MGLSRRTQRIESVKRVEALDQYAGEWVAVLDGEVIAHAPDAREVVAQMKSLGPAAAGAVLQRAALASEALAVGLG